MFKRTTSAPTKMSGGRSAAAMLPLLALAIAHGAGAQTVEPSPVAQPVPDLPPGPFGMPIEGWVVARYAVLADGTTANVRAISHMPPQLETRGIVAAIESWTFEPATVDGNPVEWHNNEVLLAFDNPGVPFEPRPPFASAYVEIDEQLKAGDLEDAKKGSERLVANMLARLREIGLAYMQAAIVDAQLENLHSAYTAIQLATDPRVTTLTDDELKVALQYRFVIEGQLGHLVEALDSYARLEALGPLPDGSGVASQAAAIATALEGEGALAVQARVDDAPWQHTLSRRTFAIADVDGSIRDLNVECNRRTTELEFASDVEWSLPESWGACVVFVDARRDTTFSLYEFK